MRIITYAIAHSAGMDAANRRMRSEGRSVWNEDDYNLATEVMCNLLGRAG